jgi:CRISPR-associated protein Cmr2
MLDGDDLGGWLSGKNSPRLREIIHPDLRRYFESLPNTREGLEAHRPVGPALHAALSTALANFALHVVPQVVRDHSGTLIYSGGDDTLALLPARTAVSCARELQKAYQLPELGQNDRLGLLMGAQATLSGGLAIVHYKEDLRTALDAARKAEKAAKKAGKNALQIAVCRRSGEHSSALCPWDFVDGVIRWVQEFENRASDRWAYHLAADRDTLGALDAEAIRAEIGRQVGRAEERTRAAFRGVLDDWEHYRTLLTGRALGLADLLVHFVTLVESASFLARGRDQ